MKEFISGVAMLLILCVFLVQFTFNQVIQNKTILAENDINTFIEEIKKDGYISPEAEAQLKTALKTDFKLEEDTEIVVEGDKNAAARKVRVLGGATHADYENSLIYYHIEYPIKNVIGASKFFGISDEENTAKRIREGKTASEFVQW